MTDIKLTQNAVSFFLNIKTLEPTKIVCFSRKLDLGMGQTSTDIKCFDVGETIRVGTVAEVATDDADISDFVAGGLKAIIHLGDPIAEDV